MNHRSSSLFKGALVFCF